jgi:integrase/recombinase XerD
MKPATTTALATVCPAELYLARRSTPASRATAQSALNAAARSLGATSYSDVDWALDYAQAATIRAALNNYEPGWSTQIWSAVRQTAAEARRLRLIDADTLTSICELPPPRGSGGRRGCTPTDDEVGRLLAVAASDVSLRGQRDAALVALLAGTGVRRAEASAMKADDIDIARGVVTVRSGKGRHLREIPAPEWCLDRLSDWLKVCGEGPVLRQVDRWGRLGSMMSGHAIAEALHRLCDTAQVERCGPHGLRRYAITGLLRAGGDVGLAQRYAGHAHPSTTILSYDARGAEELAVAVSRRPVPRAPIVMAAA